MSFDPFSCLHVLAPANGDPEKTTYAFDSIVEKRQIAILPNLSLQPKGLSSTALKVGIKYEGIYDLALIKLDRAGSTAGVFTKSRTASPAVQIDRKHLENGVAQGLVVISKNANVFTPTDHQDTKRICELVAQALNVNEEDVLISCTGVIGVPMPMEKIEAISVNMADTLQPGLISEVAEAILTTDKCAKVCSTTFGTATLIGIAKGAGMIEPNMATMLAYFFTDLDVASSTLQEILVRVNDKTFNSISVDTDTSTSDSVIIFSTGKIVATDSLLADFESALAACMTKLCQEIVYQAEGATKLIEARVVGATNHPHAKQIAKFIINSPLIKTAIFGCDPNWGRIVMALGKPGQSATNLLDPKKIAIHINKTCLYDKGAPIGLNLNALSREIKLAKKVAIHVDLGEGSGQWSAWGCDLSYHYIKTNAEYMT